MSPFDEASEWSEDLLNFINDPSRETPPLVLLYPIDNHYLNYGFGKQKWMLKLCCMYPGGEHTLTGLEIDREDKSNVALGWYLLEGYGERLAPLIGWLKKNERLIRIASRHLGEVLGWLGDDRLTDFLKKSDKALAGTSLPESNIPSGGRRLLSRASGPGVLHGLDERDYYRLDGQALVFVNEVINKQGRCGNLNSLFHAGRWLWLCNEHRDELRERQQKNARPLRETLKEYYAWARDKYGSLELVGIDGDKDTRFIAIGKLYIPLSLSARQPDFNEGGERPPGVSPEKICQTQLLTVSPDKNLLVFGDPGSGKTTFLRWLVWSATEAGGHRLEGLARGAVPIFLNLRDFTERYLNLPIEQTLQEMLTLETGGRFLSPFVERVWHRGDVLLLLDGLDEIRDNRLRQEVCAYIDRQMIGAGERNIRCVISCRYSGYGGDQILGRRFLSLDLLPIDAPQMKKLVVNWFWAVEESRLVLPAQRQASRRLARASARRVIERVADIRKTDEGFTQVISSPLLLTLLCSVSKRRGDVPWRRSDFYRACLEVLLGNWITNKGMAPRLRDPSEAVLILSRVAYNLHAQSRVNDMRRSEFANLAGETVLKVTSHASARPTAEELFNWLLEDAGVFSRFGTDSFGFLHKSFQEYLAAVEIAKKRGRLLHSLAKKINDEWWFPVIVFLLDAPEHSLFDDLMRQIIRVTSAQVADSYDAIRRCVLASKDADWRVFKPILSNPRIAPKHKVAVLRLFVHNTEPEFLRQAAKFSDHPDFELSDVATWVIKNSRRIVTGKSKAHATVATTLSPGHSFATRRAGIQMLYVPPGDPLVGANDMSTYEGPSHRIKVSEFWIGETSVTNTQYGEFLRATGFEEPKFWRVSKFMDPEQPVVGVSWYAAKAFCDWLTREVDLPVHLPSEAQWEYAARGLDNRKYPWGDELPDNARALFAKSGIDIPTPVRSYPLGKGPFGTYDQAGNVYEWNLDDWDESAYKKRVSTETIACDPLVINPVSSQHALRGGGWISVPRYLRAAFRGRQHSSSQYDYLGFRVAISNLKRP
jgi:formylglycine-generating enzyme required for sulfatase activity